MPKDIATAWRIMSRVLKIYALALIALTQLKIICLGLKFNRKKKNSQWKKDVTVKSQTVWRNIVSVSKKEGNVQANATVKTVRT